MRRDGARTCASLFVPLRLLLRRLRRVAGGEAAEGGRDHLPVPRGELRGERGDARGLLRREVGGLGGIGGELVEFVGLARVAA
jgi:hypothetical protein